MTVLFVTDELFLAHTAPPGHPERPERLVAAERGLVAAGLDGALVRLAPRRATRPEIERVHRPELVDRLEGLAARGGGRIDPDTAMGERSLEAAVLAAGAVLTAVEGLASGAHDGAWCAVRPPGHHATPSESMGFCLLNSVAIAAAGLAEAGERVAIVDIDVHHGNGSQEAFWADPRVLYASVHQWPLYPGTGAREEVGSGDAVGATVNVPVPPGATGDIHRRAIEEVIGPAVERSGAGWLLVSAGFDAHRRDPLASLALSSGDFAEIAVDLLALVPRGRAVFVLEGGYDLEALAASCGATVAALTGARFRPEPPTSGGPGRDGVDEAARLHRGLAG